MRRQLKYLNIVLTVVAVLLALNLFKGEPKQAFAELVGGRIHAPFNVKITHTFANSIH